jgi:hypothetical protein
MKVAFTAVDDAMPRRLFWQRFREAVQRNPRYVESEADGELLLPAEDLALETNWPRYGNPASAFVRGQLNPEQYQAYMLRVSAEQRLLCFVNMHPGVRPVQAFANRDNIIVADNCLEAWERALNPRTISMPSLAITAESSPQPSANKDILASFRGVLSHNCRAALRGLHDGTRIICELVQPTNHTGRIDATTGAADPRYVELLRRSVFAFIPRGDAVFSYRLLEALSFGCVPVVLSDGWVLPFDRLIDWDAAAIIVPESQVQQLPRRLAMFSPQRLAQMRDTARAIYQRHFANLDVVVESLLSEIERVK